MQPARIKQSLMFGALLLLPLGASAHGFDTHHSGFGAGLLHPLTGIDHLLALLCVGLLAAGMGKRSGLRLPLAFLAFLGAGIALGASGLGAAMAEAGIVASVILLGALVALRATMPQLPVSALVASFALFHGIAHGSEVLSFSATAMPVLGVLLSSGLMIGLGTFTGRKLHSNWQMLSGLMIAAFGAFLALS